jgi:hypothetical protein
MLPIQFKQFHQSRFLRGVKKVHYVCSQTAEMRIIDFIQYLLKNNTLR